MYGLQILLHVVRFLSQVKGCSPALNSKYLITILSYGSHEEGGSYEAWLNSITIWLAAFSINQNNIGQTNLWALIFTQARKKAKSQGVKKDNFPLKKPSVLTEGALAKHNKKESHKEDQDKLLEMSHKNEEAVEQMLKEMPKKQQMALWKKPLA